MSQECEASVLVIGQVPSALEHGQVDLMTADTGGRAIELLRMLKFDLVVIGQQLADMPVWNLVQRIRLAMPGQKWAFVGKEIGPREEVLARSLGVIGVFDSEADWSELLHVAAQIHRRTGAANRGRIMQSKVGSLN
jgi:DNA-binding response OmpR family regulator